MDQLRSAGMQGGSAIDREETKVKRPPPPETTDIKTDDSVNITGKSDEAMSSGKSRKSSKSKKKKAPSAERGSSPEITGEKAAEKTPSRMVMDEPAAADGPSTTSAQRSAMRKSACEYLGEIGKKLAAGELKGKDFQSAAYDMADRANYPGEDPLVREVAKNLVYTYVKGTTTVSDWQLKAGAVEGPAQCFRSMNRRLQNSGDRMLLGPESGLGDFLKALLQTTEGYRVPEKALKAVAHLGRTIALREKAQLSEEIRKKETPESDRALAGTFADLVEHWWNNGQVEVYRDGKRVLPGSMDIRERILGENVAVHGSAIELTPDGKKISVEAKKLIGKILEKLNWCDGRKTEGLNILEELSRTDRELAREVVTGLMGDLRSKSARNDRLVGKIVDFITIAEDKPALKELFQEHLPQLSTQISDWNARESLIAHNLEESSKVHYAETLVKTFPELLKDPRFIDEELCPLILCEEINGCNDACKLMEELWKGDAGLVKPTVDIILSAVDTPIYEGSQLRLVRKAIDEYGWLPDRIQVESLLPRLYFPPGKSQISIFSGYTSCDEFTAVVKLFNELRKKKPELLEGLEIPDHSMKMVPLGKALLDRLYTDPNKDLMEKVNLSGEYSRDYQGVGEIYEMAFSDPKDVEKVLKSSEDALAKVPSLDKLDREEQLNLAAVLSLTRKEGPPERIKVMLSPFLQQKNNGGFRTVMDKLRREAIEKGKPELASGSLGPREQILLTDRLVEMQDLLGYSFDQEKNREPILAAFREGCGKCHPGLKDMTSSLTSDTHLYRACGLITKRAKSEEDVVENWRHLKDLVEIVQGETHFDVAENFFDYMDEQKVYGKSREDMLKHCMRAYTLGTDPRLTPWVDENAPQEPARVENVEETGEVNIGGIRLDVNK